MDLGIKGRAALVMGASRGLGRAIAQALVEEGARVAVCARNAARLEQTAKEIGAVAMPCDLSVDGAAARVVADSAARIGPIGILVINTGGPPPRNFDALDDAAWRSAFEALWMSCVQAIRAALPAMRQQQWGRILVVTSISAREPLAQLMLSNALRPGLHGLINSLSRDLAADKITINAIMPGYTLTERLIEVGIDERETSKHIPAGRMGMPREFAALAAFLASDPAGYITGQAIACDGGFLKSI